MRETNRDGMPRLPRCTSGNAESTFENLILEYSPSKKGLSVSKIHVIHHLDFDEVIAGL